MSEPGDGGWLRYAADGCTGSERLTMMAADLQAAREEKKKTILFGSSKILLLYDKGNRMLLKIFKLMPELLIMKKYG